MYRQIICCLFIILVAAGCSQRFADYFPYLDDGTQKPYVVLIPMVNESDFGKSEKLEEQLTSSISKQMMWNGDLYLLPEEKVAKLMACAGNVDYFDRDLSFANHFEGAEFIVITELMEHKIVTREDVKKISKLPCGPGRFFVSMKVRLRVIDRRRETPRVVLQEISEMYQPVSNTTANNPTNICGYVEAHKWFVDQIVVRLERIIWSSR